jgi:2-keto-3-deoxy-L-rhamnonate aldolase RhmA
MSFANRLRSRDILKGMLLTVPSCEMAEAISYSQLDWAFIDTEHGAMDIRDAQNIVRALGGRVASLIRTPDATQTAVKRALDTGCDGVIVPQINTKEQAEALVRSARYPPEGERSVGISRAHKYGSAFNEYVDRANENVAVVAQIEHRMAVDNIEDIVNVRGLDAIFVGPYDLSASFGIPGQIDAPTVQAAIEKIFNVAKLAKQPIGIFCADIEAAKRALESGATLIAVGIDVLHISHAATSIVAI